MKNIKAQLTKELIEEMTDLSKKVVEKHKEMLDIEQGLREKKSEISYLISEVLRMEKLFDLLNISYERNGYIYELIKKIKGGK